MARASVSMLILISLAATVSAGVLAARAPRSTSGLSLSALRFQTVRRWPWSMSRCTIAAPMRPVPQKPISIIASLSWPRGRVAPRRGLVKRRQRPRAAPLAASTPRAPVYTLARRLRAEAAGDRQGEIDLARRGAERRHLRGGDDLAAPTSCCSSRRGDAAQVALWMWLLI